MGGYEPSLSFLLLFMGALWGGNGRSSLARGKETTLLAWQFVTPLLFLAVTRPLYPRYIIHLVPVLAIFLTVQVEGLLQNIRQGVPSAAFRRYFVGGVAVAILFTLFFSQPNIPELLWRTEDDTVLLAELVRETTEEGDVVLSDYATINFLAKRPSIPDATFIAGGKIARGVITGEMLIAQLEAYEAQMVLVHVAGGEPPPHQLVNLIDYDRFQAYLATHFHRLSTFDRAGQEIAVYIR